jgi:hypothetical protein
MSNLVVNAGYSLKEYAAVLRRVRLEILSV